MFASLSTIRNKRSSKTAASPWSGNTAGHSSPCAKCSFRWISRTISCCPNTCAGEPLPGSPGARTTASAVWNSCRNVSIPTTGGHSARRSAARTCISRIWMRTRPSHTLNTALKNLRATITGSRARWSRSKTKPRTRSPRSPTWWTSTNADAAKTPSSTNPAVTV